jgi:hypothetical protein
MILVEMHARRAGLIGGVLSATVYFDIMTFDIGYSYEK